MKMDKNTSEPSSVTGAPPKTSEDLIKMPLKELTLLFCKFFVENGYEVADGLSINLTVSATSSSGRRPPTDPSVRRCEGKIEVVVRGVSHEIETDMIQDDLEAQGYPVYEVHSMYRGDGTELNRFMVILLNTDKAKGILTDLKTVCGLSGITVACPYKGRYYGKCHRCRAYGHAADECEVLFDNVSEPGETDSVDDVNRKIGILTDDLGAVAVDSSRQAPAASDRNTQKKKKSKKKQSR